MSHINFPSKHRDQLKVPETLGTDLLKFKDVIIPCGFMPAGYEFAEGLTLSHIAEIMIEKLRSDGLIPECDCSNSVCTPTENTFTFASDEIVVPDGVYTIKYKLNGGSIITYLLEITEGYGFHCVRSILALIPYDDLVTDPITTIAAFNLSPDATILTGAAIADVTHGQPVTIEYLVSDDPIDLITALFGGTATIKSCGYKQW